MITAPAFIKVMRTLPGITDAELELILVHFTMRTVKAKEHIVSEGEICKQIAYVNQGCFSYYRILDNGKKSIIHFAFEDWWTGDLQSFINREPATTYWQAVEDSEIISLSRLKFENLINCSPAFRHLFQTKTQRGYVKAMENAASDKSDTAEEKYLRMMRDYPQIILRIPHYDVASYLGIAPESLSRIRNKISNQKKP